MKSVRLLLCAVDICVSLEGSCGEIGALEEEASDQAAGRSPKEEDGAGTVDPCVLTDEGEVIREVG